MKIILNPGSNKRGTASRRVGNAQGLDSRMSAGTATLDQADAWRPAVNPWVIALAVTLATFMEVLDTSIANVALPHVPRSLSAGQDESTWVLTSYLVSNAIVLPSERLVVVDYRSQEFLHVGCVALFTISSFLCGLCHPTWPC